GGQEKVFVFTLSAVGHRPDAETVGENLRADTADAVVDGEAVFDAVKRVRKNGILILRERLNGFDFVVIDDGELAERLIAIRFHGVWLVRACRKTAFVWTSDNRIQICVHDVVVRIEHLDDWLTGAGMSGWIYGVIVENRLSTRGFLRGAIRVLLGGQ